MADPGPSSSHRKSASTKSSANRQDKQDLDQKHSKAIDFTQRKRWADILVNELSGAIMFILSSAATILFVGEAARELLNWNDANIQGMEVTAFLHPDDVAPFSKAFVNCIREQAELAIFVRLKSYHTEPTLTHTGGKWPLYEIKGHPHFGAPNPSAPFAMATGFPQAECKAFFATARPYPTRGSAVLDSFLELKVENERLHRSLEELRVAHPDLAAAVKEDALAVASAPSRRRTEKEPRSADDIAVDSNGVPLHPFAYDFTLPRPPQGGAYSGRVPSVPATGEDISVMRRHSVAGIAGEETSSRKRGKRKAAGMEQRVCHTCGRTDSPEWRKGPLGPKTLCNACGLRFSKKVKTKPSDPSPDDKDEPGINGDDGQGDDDPGDAGDPGMDGGGMVDGGGGISQSPLMQTHHELDFTGSGMGYDMSALAHPPPSNKLAAAHQLQARQSFLSGLMPSSSSLPHHYATNGGPGSNSYLPVSMTMSMPGNLSAWFASGNTVNGRSPTSSFDHTGYVGDAENPIRAPQPKQALPPLQTQFEYNAALAGGPSSTMSSGHSMPPPGPSYHHYQPPGQA